MVSRFIAILSVALYFVVGVNSSCNAPEEEVTLKIEFRGEWSPLTFPKQYPKFRKNAQFSPLVGKFLNSSYYCHPPRHKNKMMSQFCTFYFVFVYDHFWVINFGDH